jgi:hypothetical protein
MKQARYHQGVQTPDATYAHVWQPVTAAPQPPRLQPRHPDIAQPELPRYRHELARALHGVERGSHGTRGGVQDDRPRTAVKLARVRERQASPPASESRSVKLYGAQFPEGEPAWSASQPSAPGAAAWAPTRAAPRHARRDFGGCGPHPPDVAGSLGRRGPRGTRVPRKTPRSSPLGTSTPDHWGRTLAAPLTQGAIRVVPDSSGRP